MRRSAFSIIELLIVIFIIALVMSLVVMAVQQSRESADRAQCKNNLRQLGLGFVGFETREGRFPSGMTFAITGPLVDSRWCIRTFMADILPYVDAQALASQYDKEAIFHDQRNRSVVSQPLPIAICPSTPSREPVFTSSFIPSAVLPGPAREQIPPEVVTALDEKYAATYLGAASDYTVLLGAVTGVAKRAGYHTTPDMLYLPGMFPLPVENLEDLMRQVAPILTSSGVVTLSRGLRASELNDGLSNTLMIVEIAGRPQRWIDGQRHEELEPIDRPWCDPRIVQYLEADTLIQGDNLQGLYSFHPGVANVLFADGHVDSLAESTEDRRVIAAMTPAYGD